MRTDPFYPTKPHPPTSSPPLRLLTVFDLRLGRSWLLIECAAVQDTTRCLLVEAQMTGCVPRIPSASEAVPVIKLSHPLR